MIRKAAIVSISGLFLTYREATIIKKEKPEVLFFLKEIFFQRIS